MHDETIIVRKPKWGHRLQNQTPVSTLNKSRVTVEHNAEEPFQIEGDKDTRQLSVMHVPRLDPGPEGNVASFCAKGH